MSRPKVGDQAFHVMGLDPRRVTKVSDDGETISLDIEGYDLDDLPASNYDFAGEDVDEDEADDEAVADDKEPEAGDDQ